ncbi:MAG: DUF5696 domain-containing protein [Kiritimatiellia bacterium]
MKAFKKMRALLAAVVVCMAVGVFGGELALGFEMQDGTRREATAPLAFEKGRATFRLARADVPKGLRRLKITCADARVPAGTDGYWVNSDGELGTFRPRAADGVRRSGRPHMPFFGAVIPGASFVAIVKGMPYNYSFSVELKKGVYELSMAYDLHMEDVYEDLEVEFIQLEGADANYAGMARVYRAHQLARGAVKPLRERAKAQPILDYAAQWPEVRVRHAWKPVPSPEPDQTVKNEPPVKPVITFDRLRQIADEFRRQGIGGAEFCLVGWNVGGHDGRWPQVFPVEPSLGGEEKLRAAIAHAQNLGYQVVAHCNHRDAYLIADAWDAEYIREKNADGSLRRGRTTWGGGRMYTICPQRAYEKFALQQMPMVRALGFRGLHYLDVYSCVGAERCDDPRHPLDERASVRYVGHILQLGRDTFGGIASEGSYDQNAGQLDYVLYVSFARPFEAATYRGLVDRLVPMFQLVYNGIILSNPYTTTVNAQIKGRPSELKTIEFGGRPTFYFYANFLTPGKGRNWMGDVDLECGTDEALAASVAHIKRGVEAYQKVWRLQYEFMDGHDELAPGIYRTRYSNGARVYVNYNESEIAVDGVRIPALDWIVREEVGK